MKVDEFNVLLKSFSYVTTTSSGFCPRLDALIILWVGYFDLRLFYQIETVIIVEKYENDFMTWDYSFPDKLTCYLILL